ncbi:MAG: hypothetical protein HY225_03030 [Candidatus Vogelbacteria bacterium]|nr:hypothetical protein [Candidatus Vogelbacteria bacterium]
MKIKSAKFIKGVVGTDSLLENPGYGYAKAPVALREKILKLTKWYLVDSGYKQKKVVLIIDAYVGPTSNDLEMLRILEKENKNVIVIANKVDKLRSSDKIKQLKKIQMTFPNYKVIPFSAEKKIGLDKLVKEIMS